MQMAIEENLLYYDVHISFANKCCPN